MALSFQDSLKQGSQGNSVAMLSATENVAAYAVETQDVAWTLDSNNYKYYAEFADEKVSVIDESKNVSVNKEQINLTQEQNSQYIPFVMPRYYDGFDLSKTTIYIHYVNRDNYEDYAKPINVYYSEDQIRFGWLVGSRATAVNGTLRFEIEATGTTSQGDNYTWKTKPNAEINILESLSGNGEIEVGDTWTGDVLLQVIERAEEAKGSANLAINAANEASTAAQEAKNAAKNAAAEAQKDIATSVSSEVNKALVEYYTRSEVDSLLENIDISEQLQEMQDEIDSLDGLAKLQIEYDGEKLSFYNGGVLIKEVEISSDPSQSWTTAYTETIEEKISAAKMDTVEETKEGIDQAVVLLESKIEEEYAKKESVNGFDASIKSIESSAATNKASIQALGEKISELDETVSSLNTSPKLTYEATYDEEQVYTLWEIEGEGDEEVRTPKGQFKIQGGGASTGSVLKIEYVTKTPYVVTANDQAVLAFKFSGTDSSGDEITEGQATWKVGQTTVATHTVVSGENSFDLTNYIRTGTQKVLLTITDDAGSLVTKSWTVQKIDVRIESSFNDKLAYQMGEVSFDYTPYGAISKTIHFNLDGEEIGQVVTSASGIPQSYAIKKQEHGAHLLDVYMTAEINGNTIESNHVLKDIIWFDSSCDIPVIATTYQNFTARQHDTTNIEIVVFDPKTESPTITLSEDGAEVSTIQLNGNTHTWAYKALEAGTRTLTITCRDAVKTLKATIEELHIDVSPVTTGLAFDFNPVGKTNGDAERDWSYGDVSMSVSDNFDWVNGGYQIDENGDSYFCVKAGTRATINYPLFKDDAKRNGKEFKIVFKSTNVQNPDAEFLSCVDNTTDRDHIGIRMFAHEAKIYGQAGNLELPYSEEDVIEFEFNISKDTEAVPMVMGYEDGVSSRPMVYDSSYSFTQNAPKNIVFGSDDCDLHIYRMKVYNTSLSDRSILNNFIADARSAQEMIDRYDRNQIYDENEQLDPDILAEKCPWLRVYKVSAPYFTNSKKDKVSGTTIQQIYKNGDPVLDNWTCYNAQHSGQGTSSNNYGAAGRNLDFIMNQSGIEGVEPYFILGDGSSANAITLTRSSVPVTYLNAKVNIASSNNLTNAMMTNRYNNYKPYNRPITRDNGVDPSFVKDTMEFYNCVIFISETNEDLSTHREFADTDYHFYAIGNIGDSKKTDNTRLTDMNDPYECCVEVMDVELPLSDFPVDTMMNAMGYTIDEKTGEKVYTWAKDENLGFLYEKTEDAYQLTSDQMVDLSKTYYVDILEQDEFDEAYTYGWRYIHEGEDENENEEIKAYCKKKWIEMYRFVTQSSEEEFKAKFSDYFVKDTILYYYLFTMRYTMVDNRAKNLFFHYSKTGELDSEGEPMRKWMLDWGYDFDTCLGLNNYGKQVYRYGLEDTDIDENGEEVFRESDSTFFCRVRDLFANELKVMYNELESKNTWHAESFINQCDAWQDEFPEELWRLDITRKYIRTFTESFINGKPDEQFLRNMSNGRMKYQRRQWERSQEKYMASKYQSSTASSDNAVFRCSVPAGELVVEPNYRLRLTPYAHMYLNVKYGTQTPIQVKAQPNVEYEIPFDGNRADIVDVYSASLIRDFGDLSACYIATADTSKAEKVKQLIFGNETEGYDNPSFTTLTTGANGLLERLNIENVSGLTQSLDLSALGNLKELYAKGSNIGGVIFADGGQIQIAELPAVNALLLKNLHNLNTLDVESFEALTRLVIENCALIDTKQMLEQAVNLNRVRLISVDWTLDDTSLLERLYNLAGIDSAGYNTDRAIITGRVSVPVIREQQLREYQEVWSDLEITYDSMIEQYPVTFVNEDGAVLEIQYVDKGGDAIDPITRKDNPIATPKKESSVSTDYTFAGWDSTLTNIFSARTISATYSESIRQYTVKYVSKGITLQETTADYGTCVWYNGETPTYTVEESAYKYSLFSRWDKSGLVDGDKTINAIFDTFVYTPTAFNGKILSDLTPVELYALGQLGLDQAEIDLDEGDTYTISFGQDYDYDDVESSEIISEKYTFNGTNYLDTDIKLFDEDKDFVLAIDYEFASDNDNNAVLAQCFQSNGSNGFKLWYNSGVKATWGTTSEDVAKIGAREMLVLRHTKGSNHLYVYKSDMSGDAPSEVELERTRSTTAESTLVFGCKKADDGAYENYAIGNIYWAKVWFADLGEVACRKLAGWIHENIELEVSGFKKYYLSGNPSKRSSMTLIATNLMSQKRAWNTNGTNVGGFKEATLNTHLNGRMYNALNDQMKAIIKKVSVSSSVGAQSTELSSSDCYITIPAIIELSNESSINIDPYIYEGETIPFMISDSVRKRTFADGTASSYWTRSPNASYSSSYIYQIDENGKVYGFGTPKSLSGVLIELSV